MQIVAVGSAPAAAEIPQPWQNPIPFRTELLTGLPVYAALEIPPVQALFRRQFYYAGQGRPSLAPGQNYHPLKTTPSQQAAQHRTLPCLLQIPGVGSGQHRYPRCQYILQSRGISLPANFIRRHHLGPHGPDQHQQTLVPGTSVQNITAPPYIQLGYPPVATC